MKRKDFLQKHAAALLTQPSLSKKKNKGNKVS